MEGPYERILALVPPHELQAGYNSMVQDGYVSLKNAVDSVSAAFAKLEEVRDAVAKLEKGAPVGGPSDSLMIAMDSTIALQKEVRRGIDKLVATITGKKREREEKVLVLSRPEKHTSLTFAVPNIASRSGERNQREPEPKQTEQKSKVMKQEIKRSGSTDDSSRGDVLKETKSDSSDGDSGSDSDSDVEGSEAAWKALIGASSGKKALPRVKEDAAKLAIPVASRQPTPVVAPKQNASLTYAKSGRIIGLQPAKDGKSATHLMTIVKDLNSLPIRNLNFVISETLLVLKESVYEDFNGRQQVEVASSLEIVIGWAINLENQNQHLESYLEYSNTMKIYVTRLPTSALKASLERLLRSLWTAVNNLKTHANSDDRPPATSCDEKNGFGYLVEHAHSLKFRSRMRCFFAVLIAFKKETTASVSKRNMKRIVNGMETVARWMNEDPREPHQLYLYRLLLEAMSEFAARLPTGGFKGNIVGLTQRMSDVIAETPSNRTQEFLAKIRNRAVKLATKLGQWQTSNVLAGTIDEALKTMDAIVNYVAVGWAPWQDLTVLKCATILKTHVVRLQHAGRITPIDKWRMNKIKRWKMEEPLSKQG